MTEQQIIEAEKIMQQLCVIRHYHADLVQMTNEDRMSLYPMHLTIIANDDRVKNRIRSLNECLKAVLEERENDLENQLREL